MSKKKTDKKENMANLSKTKLLLFSFLLPLFIMLVAFATLGITPFGERTMLYGDASSYYINEFVNFRSQISGERGFLYSFSKSLGGNNINTLGRLLSPFSWAMLLAGWNHIEETFAICIILVSALYGVTMMLLLCELYPDRFSNLLFSTSYALMGFAVVYNYNVVFFSGPLMLPLMVLGLKRIFEKKSGLLYAVSIAFCLGSNFQIGYILCVSSLLFFIATAVLRYGAYPLKKTIVHYVPYSLAGGFLSAAFWLPNLLSLREGRGSQVNAADYTFENYDSLLSMSARFFSGAASPQQIIDGYPAVFCGILCLFLVVLFFFDKKTAARKKTVAGALLLVFGLSFYIHIFSTLFQGSHTNWFNFRHSFVFTFLLILIAASEFERLTEMKKKTLRNVLLFFGAATLLIFTEKYEFLSMGNVVLDFAFLAVILGGVYYHRKKDSRMNDRALIYLLLMCTGLQLYVNYYVSMESIFTKDWADGLETVSQFNESVARKKTYVDLVKTSDDGFYRMEDTFSKSGASGNDGLLFDYNGLGHTRHDEATYIVMGESKYGISTSAEMQNWYDRGMSASMESLLGLKYVISTDDLNSEKGYIPYMDGGIPAEGLVYKNPNALPVAVLSDGGIKRQNISDTHDVFVVQNRMWQGLTGEEVPIFTEEEDVTFKTHNSFESVEVNMAEAAGENDPGNYISYEFTAKRSGPIYLYNLSSFAENFGTGEDVLKYIGTYEKGDRVYGLIGYSDTVTEQTLLDLIPNIRFGYEDRDVLNIYAGILQSRDISLERVTDAHLRGTVTAQEGQRLFFTIPYNTGWTLWIDGQKAPLELTGEIFMSAALTPGEHTYELKYRSPGLTAGIALSVLAIFLLALLGLVRLHPIGYKVKQTG
ncbi:MAG: YfhO family protein [Lachnospiraceae bacterium]|nr:YfhO family protein [Lachnospiraceae bacterium]